MVGWLRKFGVKTLFVRFFPPSHYLFVYLYRNIYAQNRPNIMALQAMLQQLNDPSFVQPLARIYLYHGPKSSAGQG